MRFAMTHGMRVLVVNESAEKAELLREGLAEAGYEVLESLASPFALLKAIERESPDVIVIDTDSPSRDVLEHIVMVTRHTPRPVVMFAADDAPEMIRAAVSAGVSAYVVDGFSKERVRAIVDVAVARFEQFQGLRTELAEANLRLAERKLIERARGLLMKSRGLDEESAFTLLRKMAMDRKLKMADVAQRVIDASDLLGA